MTGLYVDELALTATGDESQTYILWEKVEKSRASGRFKSIVENISCLLVSLGRRIWMRVIIHLSTSPL